MVLEGFDEKTIDVSLPVWASPRGIGGGAGGTKLAAAAMQPRQPDGRHRHLPQPKAPALRVPQSLVVGIQLLPLAHTGGASAALAFLGAGAFGLAAGRAALALPHGEVCLPSFRAHAHVYAHAGPDAPGEGERAASLRELGRRVAVAGGAAQSDGAGHGVVARAALRRGETLVDPSVFFVSRPPDYALAHLPQFHALEFGSASYFLLREPALGLASLTYFVNEARHGGAPGPAANFAYKVVRPRAGGVGLGLLVLEDSSSKTSRPARSCSPTTTSV